MLGTASMTVGFIFCFTLQVNMWLNQFLAFCAPMIIQNCSHHDVILSNFAIPTKKQPMITTEPKYDQVRTNIQWSEEGQLRYAELVGPYLRQARETWLHPNSQTCMSVMLSITNSLMTKCATKCATKTNQFKILEAKTETKSRKIPQVIKGSRGKMIRAHTRFKLTEKSLGPDRLQVPHNRSIFICNKKKYQHALRHLRFHQIMQKIQSL